MTSFLGSDNWGDRTKKAIHGKDAKPYRFIGNCATLDDVEQLNVMIDEAEEVDYAEMAKHCDLRPFQDEIGYEQDREDGLTMEDDWHISYHKSFWRGLPCYYHTHSAYEWVYVLFE